MLIDWILSGVWLLP